jgi:hypothetical protein
MKIRSRLLPLLVAAASLLAMTAAAAPATAVSTVTDHVSAAAVHPTLQFVKVSPRRLTPAEKAEAAAAGAPTCVQIGVCFQLVSDVNPNTKYCLNANSNYKLGNGVPIQIWTCNWNDNDLWELGACKTVSSGLTWCELEIQEGYGNYCLNANDSHGIYEGSPLQLYTCGMGDNALWIFQQTGGVPECCYLQVGTNGGPWIVTVDLSNGTPGNGTKAWIWKPTSSSGTIWIPTGANGPISP